MDGSTTPFEVAALPSWSCVDFISDLHLADNTPRAFAAWAAYLSATRADAVFILGDLFEAWIGDDARHEGFEARAAAVLTKAASRCRLFAMVGNRDFLLGADMLESCRVAALPDPSVLAAFGERVLMTHGDAWCLGDVDYQAFRKKVREPSWQAQVLARPLAERRLMAQHLRSESERAAMGHPEAAVVDVDTPTAVEAMRQAQASTLVHGHTHRPATEILAAGRIRHVLSDWDLDHAPAPRAEVLRRDRQGWARLSLDSVAADA